MLQTSVRQRHGFTLVELLVVIAIISILAGLLLPALTAAQEAASTVSCLSNLRQTRVAVQLYGDDYGEYPDMVNMAGNNLNPHGNHPDFPSGVCRSDGATGIVGILKGPSGRYPAWMDKVRDHSGEGVTDAMLCTTPPGDWSRGGAWSPPTGYGNGPNTGAYSYWGPGVHWDDVNPQAVLTAIPHGLKWISNAPYDAHSGYPANWDLRVGDERGVLLACPCLTFDGPAWTSTGFATCYGTYAYTQYGTDFANVRPHGVNRRQRNYMFVDGHAQTYMQMAAEGGTPFGIPTTWPDSPNGYY